MPAVSLAYVVGGRTQGRLPAWPTQVGATHTSPADLARIFSFGGCMISTITNALRGGAMKKLKLIACLALAACAWAQSDRGTITGTVADSSGALIPNAKIVLTNAGTQSRYDSVTSATGNYTIPTLPVG